MSEKSFRLRGFGLLLLLASLDANADDGWQSMFNFNGFGTLGVVHSNNPDADFVNNVFESRGAGESTSWSPAVDSKLGLQVTATPTDKLKAVVQLIIEQKWNGTYVPTVEWANLTYHVTSDFDVRAGRIVWPMFVRSESQNVGFANFSVRPSAELEAEMPNTHSDGIDATYRLHLGPTTHAVTVFGGQSEEIYGDYYANTKLTVKKIIGVSDMIDWHDLTLHAAAMHMQYTFTAPGVTPLPVQLPIYSLGAVYDTSTWYGMGDAQLAVDPYYGKMKSFAVQGGRHFGSFSPYVGYSQFTQATFGPGVPVPLHTPTQADRFLGLRWDVRTGVDLKFQFDSIKTGDVAGSFPISLVFPNSAQLYPTFLKHPEANVVSAVVDFTF